MLTNIIILIFVFAVMLAFFMLSPRFCHYLPQRQIFSPWNTTLIVWIIILTLYTFVHKELYAVSEQFVYGITIWVFTFTISSVLTFIIFPSYKKASWQVCEKNVDIITLITLILVPIAVYKAVQHAFMLGSPEDLFLTLREQAVDPEQNQLGIVKYFVYVVNVLLIIELSRIKQRKLRLILIIILCILFFIATMGKSTLFMYLFSGLYILYEKRKISLKPILFGAIFLILLIPIMYMLRGGSKQETDTETLINILMIYIISSIIAFGLITPNSSHLFGENIFRPFYNILHIFGFTSNTPANTIQDFCYIPLPTNVYTVLSPYYKDFGLTGIFIFALFEGIIIGAIYKYSKTGCNIITYIYAYIFTMLIMQFFDEMFFQGLSSIFQMMLIILFCHTKIKLK
ncbi:O-antigen polymerase [uncultured Prevotella sp.]|uniref:O-antigen polymerase n=1 Tax=uncultured Prevotella sp. TaxID=159272 RepID=UPI0025D56C88|nr:O-antigen polymerase [uncultured Prevotella sp.]